MHKQKVLSLLRSGPKTTQELRDAGVFTPAARVKELRSMGHRIDTVLSQDHRGARYNLVEECEK